uniref:Uncharacterized protein n=1 Tax=Tetradesmus obliquus TaxID=3088 RepID=A0A383VG45_TETOB
MVNYAAPCTPGQQQLQLKLVLDHDCMHQGCWDEACRHCRYSSTRCSGALRSGYVSGQPLLARCGGAPAARLEPEQGGDAGELLLPGWQLQVQLLNSKAYEDLSTQGQPVTHRTASLLPGQGQSAAAERRRATRQLRDAAFAGWRRLPGWPAAHQPEKATDNSKHSGKTTHCRLLLTVIAPPGSPRLPGAPFAGAAPCALPPLSPQLPLVSDPFKVVTARSKGAAKAEVPLPSEAVSRLDGIGQNSAVSLKAQREVDGKQLEPVETVGQFHALQEWVAEGGTLRRDKLLTATNIKLADYSKAVKHVQRTVIPDFRPRVWWGPAAGLLCQG